MKISKLIEILQSYATDEGLEVQVLSIDETGEYRRREIIGIQVDIDCDGGPCGVYIQI